MPETANLRNPEMFESYKLYFRTRSRSTDTYRQLVERIGREPNVVYPDGWYDQDIDRAIKGKYGVHFGFEEYKHVDRLEEPFVWNGEEQKELVKRKLVDSSFQIDYPTLNFTIPGCKGVLSEEDNVIGFDKHEGDYDISLKTLKRLKIKQGETGKGVFLFTFYTDDLNYFSPINFTGSEIIFGKDGWGIPPHELRSCLERVGEIIEPCFNEFLLFLVQAYIRQDFSTLYKYLAKGGEGDPIRFEFDWEQEISDEFSGYEIGDLDTRISKWAAYCYVMEWILDCIHFDTILGNPREYAKFVDLVRTGNIVKYIETMIKNKHKYNLRSHIEYIQRARA